ncbi:hypothetical protein [uncultured Parasutterella sp.]|uniref:hypothetical protein n=1 Tax=uncultured Parasutterella sp. TaxID=1263098 RepID=UPI0027299A8F|nr:hypothetical protein [uncultured Parasutterella sp.]
MSEIVLRFERFFRRVKNRCIEKKLFANNLSVDFDVFYPPEKDSLLRKLRALLFRSKAGYSLLASLLRRCPQPSFASRLVVSAANCEKLCTLRLGSINIVSKTLNIPHQEIYENKIC